MELAFIVANATARHAHCDLAFHAHVGVVGFNAEVVWDKWFSDDKFAIALARARMRLIASVRPWSVLTGSLRHHGQIGLALP